MANNILNNFLTEDYYLTDGGLETTLIFHQHIHIPHFASFHLLNRSEHRKAMDAYYRQYLQLAKQYGTGFILESVTWRANSDWGYKLGYSQKELVQANQTAIAQMKVLKKEFENDIDHIVISGCIGPRYDGYVADQTDSLDDAKIYHSLQIKTLKDSGVDMVSGITMTNIDEAAGIVLAAKDIKVPVVISFTVEVDGHLPDGKSLETAIGTIDQLSNGYPLYYMVNCAHPQHFEKRLSELNALSNRVQGIRANASCKSHAELDEATELDTGNKKELAQWYKVLKTRHSQMKVFGGCCGTDESHLKEICQYIFQHAIKKKRL